MSIIRGRLEQEGIQPDQIRTMKIEYNSEKRVVVWSVETTDGSQYDFDFITGEMIYSRVQTKSSK